MSFLQNITVLVLTYNEENNIRRTLLALKEFPHVVVVDSFSSDTTADIVREFPNVRLVERQFEEHASQWNFGLHDTDIQSNWILALDADYLLSSDLINEISCLNPDDTVSGYEVRFRYCVFGHPLRGALYPPHVILFRRERAHYVQRGHTQRLCLEGGSAILKNKVYHDDRKPLSRWLSSQQRYAALEAEYILGSATSSLRKIDRVRRIGCFSPILSFFYVMFAKGCIFDGWPGWYYTLQRTAAEIMITLEIIDRRSRNDRG